MDRATSVFPVGVRKVGERRDHEIVDGERDNTLAHRTWSEWVELAHTTWYEWVELGHGVSGWN